MEKRKSLIETGINYTKVAIICIYEGYTLKDKITLFRYFFLNIPKFFMEFMKGKPHNNTLPAPVVIRNKNGIFFCGDNRWSVQCLYSGFEKETNEKIKLEEGVFIDVGANLGKYTIKMGKMLGNRGRVIAVEPEKDNISILKRNIELNELNNITVVEKGCFSKKTTLKFHLSDFGNGQHSLIKKDVGSKVIQINVDTLDNIVSDLGLTRVDMIKIDVEGAESEVLKGATKTLRKYHPRIILEAWNDDYLNKVLKILKPFNYKMKRISVDNYMFE